tara:strand:+ start:287 stop:496 length:210 start_codon:yes stop_codon:yes gene_type:complete
MKTFKQFESVIDQKRLEMQKDIAKQRIQAKIDTKKDKRAIDVSRRLDQIERELPDETADEIMRRLKRGN